MNTYLVILLLIISGFGLRRMEVLPEGTADVLNRLAITFCLPALIVLHAPALQWSWALWPLVAVPWGLLLVSSVMVWAMARHFGWSREITAVMLVMLPLGNTSFLGFPLVEALMGAEFLSLAVVYDQLGSFLIVVTHALLVISWYQSAEVPSWRAVARRVSTFPPFIALLVAVTLGNDGFPAWLMELIERLSLMLLPLVTIAIGAGLQLKLVPDYRWPLVFGVAAKLVVLPALVWGVLWWLMVRGPVAQVSLLEAAMPPMITAAALLSQARLAPALANGMVAWGVLASALTVPLWFWWSGLTLI